MALGGQLQALPLRPGLHGSEPPTQSSSPVVGAQARSAGLRVHQLVEEPSAGEMKELGEELYGEGGVRPAAAQERHGVHQGVQHLLCRSNQGTRDPGGVWTSGERQAEILTLPIPSGSEPWRSGSTRNVGRWILSSCCRACSRQLREARRVEHAEGCSAEAASWNASVPVGAVHQVGQIPLTLPRQRAQISVALEEVEQFRGVGHPEGQSAGAGTLALRRRYTEEE